MYVRDTIAAISTPLGEGGIGIVRISGDDSCRIALTLFRGRQSGGFSSHRFYYGTIVDLAGDILDEALVVFMKGPNSYTCEDVVEIHCHGGLLVTQRVLDLVLMSGARLSEPGEFTKRAFLNGRIDLLQAEGVIDVIRSKTDTALRLAQHQREGLLSTRLIAMRDRLRTILALIEAHIDFPEDEVDPATLNRFDNDLAFIADELSNILATYRAGKVLRDGVAVAIVGKPNVGKSSLLNTLLQEKRAIVTAIPGTTRDVIEEVLNLDGLAVRLLDTAGIRETEDEVEQMGIDLTLDRIARADLVLFVVDVSRPFEPDDYRICDELKGSTALVVNNKIDLESVSCLPPSFAEFPSVSISTRSGEGIETLRKSIYDTFITGKATDSREFVALSQTRHRDALQKALASLGLVEAALANGADLELIAVDLREALQAIGEVTGETTPDTILDLIFSQFCIGK